MDLKQISPSDRELVEQKDPTQPNPTVVEVPAVRSWRFPPFGLYFKNLSKLMNLVGISKISQTSEFGHSFVTKSVRFGRTELSLRLRKALGEI